MMQVWTVGGHGVHEVGQALEAVTDEQEHVLDAPVLQLGQHRHPESGSLAVAASPAQDVRVCEHVDPVAAQTGRLRTCLSRTLTVIAFEEDRGVRRRQRPRSPHLALLDDHRHRWR
jgi:hypothetical protein